MASKITIHDIARELNLTAATISRALNDHPNISAATKELVKSTALRMNYKRNRLATSLRLGRSNVIGVVIPNIGIKFFGYVVQGIEEVANEHGYQVLLFQSNEDPESEIHGIETLLQSNVDGIILSVTKETVQYDHLKEVEQRNIPLVLFDRVEDSLDLPSVVIDDYKGAYMATEHLIEQGYRQIAHISGQQHIKIFNDRLRGYADALRTHGMQINDKLIAYGSVSVESGRLHARKMLQGKNPPDAFFAVEDLTALGALQAIKMCGLNVPRDVGLVGFGNDSFGAYISPSLTTVDQESLKMGKASAKLLIRMKNGKEKQKKISVKKQILEPVLIVRESSQK